jgi:glutathione S-transferase
MLRFFYASNTCALATHIALEDAGAEYEAVRLDFGGEEQRKPEYLSVNPKGRVPALATEQGVLTETPALLAWVAQSYPAAKLAPADPFGFARAQAFNNYICATVHVAHAHKMRGYRWADDPAAHEAMKAKVPTSVLGAFLLIEQGMLEGPFVLGAAYSICDPYLFTLAQWLEADRVDVSKLPRVMAHRAMMAERGSVKRAVAMEPGARAAGAV